MTLYDNAGREEHKVREEKSKRKDEINSWTKKYEGEGVGDGRQSWIRYMFNFMISLLAS